MLTYDVVDVFTDRPYAGNPLAVVHGGAELTAGQMQRIAGEFNLSETVFPLPPTTSGADYRARIFTPSREMPFAGHPSIGVAWVLARAGLIGPGDVVQECGAGLLPVHVTGYGAQVTGGAPEVGPPLDGVALAAAVGLAPEDVDTAVPAGIAGAGAPFAFLAVGPDAVTRAVPDPAAVRALTEGLIGLVVVAYDAGGSAAHMRMFAPGSGVAEDPATGSAAVALGVFLVDRGVIAAAGQTGFLASQGAELGRPSQLGVLVHAQDGAALRASVWGNVAAVARGELLALPGE
ncbi:PhzF family phenazine biosynthesis protein [Pseudonocardia sp.]|uniref:PhzF family phenazine biosynthesis protein n=1 Tax=Pseudonocardia sp. TaxID=60912 RepID=UPI00261F5477|nr:PhzF family phenazine biosynthesis protein [Pseudonocardia sp.]